MNSRVMGVLAWWLICLLCSTSVSADELISVPTRGGERITYWWMPVSDASATVLLFSGGAGGIGMREGRPQSENFLIRSRERFRDQGFNVVLLGNPSDKRAMDDVWRVSEMHRSDVATVLQDLRRRGADRPVWLVGTSRGTISATALAIGLPDEVAGLVLTAAVTSASVPAAVTRQPLERLHMPVLIYHHRDDACRITPASEAESVFKGLHNARVKKLWLVQGGENPSGDPCEALHWHGFVGMENQAVKDIGGWIRQPVP
jgi:pimeloyl-ACP methyl ester carboxylesterase